MSERVAELFENLTITACVFSMYTKMGPEVVFAYPLPEYSMNYRKGSHKTQQKEYDMQNLIQIAVKSISLLLGDYIFEKDDQEELSNTSLFGVLPYADINAIALTYFKYVFDPKRGKYVPATFSILVDESKRSFIYDYIEKLKSLLVSFTDQLISVCNEQEVFEDLEYEKIFECSEPQIYEFFSEIAQMQEKPLSPITKNRRIKIVFTGLEATGKTSFISVINKRYSQLVALPQTQRPINDSLNLLGTTIMRWDIPGQRELREDALLKSDLYLFEADVLYFFVDVTNPRIEESSEFLTLLINQLNQYDTNIPIVFIFSKVDEDIAQSPEIRNVIHTMMVDFNEITGEHPIRFFEVSIFAPYTILNAFSYGIRQLSPNRIMLERLLHEFMEKFQIYAGLLVNENGLVLATQEIEDPQSSKKITVRQIFEITAPHFTTIASQYNEVLAIDGKTTQYQFSDEDIAVLKRFMVQKFTFYLLFYVKDKEILQNIEQEFPHFIERIENLLQAYIA